jgi:hypothetical protein
MQVLPEATRTWCVRHQLSVQCTTCDHTSADRVSCLSLPGALPPVRAAAHAPDGSGKDIVLMGGQVNAVPRGAAPTHLPGGRSFYVPDVPEVLKGAPTSWRCVRVSPSDGILVVRGHVGMRPEEDE